MRPDRTNLLRIFVPVNQRAEMGERLKLDCKSMKDRGLPGEAQLKEKRARKYCEEMNVGEKVLPAAKSPLRW